MSSDSEEEEQVEVVDPDQTIVLKVRFAFEYEAGQLKVELPEYAA